MPACPDLACPSPVQGRTSRWTRRLLLAALLAMGLAGLGGLAACDRRAVVDAFVDHDVDAEARRDFERLASHDPSLADRIAPEQRGDHLQADLDRMASLLPGIVTDQHVVGWFARTVNGDTRYDVTYEARRQDASYPFLLESIRLHRTAAGLVIEGMTVKTLSRSLEEINAFTLSGRPAWMLAFLAAMVVIPAAILVTLVACARDRGLRRKWAWMLFIAFGMGMLHLDWTDGALGFQPALGLLGAGFTSSGVAGPWILSISFPVSAILYWVRRRVREDATLAAASAPECAAKEVP